MSENQNNLTNVQDEMETPISNEPPIVEELPADTQKKNKKKPISDKRVTGKESFSRTRVIIGVLLIVAAVVVAALLIPALSGSQQSYSILYAKQDVPAGVQITTANINNYFGTYITTDPNLRAIGIPSNKANELIGGQFAKRDIYQGKYPSMQDFTKINLIHNDRVPEGKLLVGLDIPSLEGNVGYMPKAGDIIKIYRMVDYEYDEGDIYFDAANIHVPIGNHGSGSRAEPYEYLQYVQIHAAIDGDLRDSDASGTAEVAFILAVSDGVQVQQVIEAANSGNYYFALVSSGDKSKADALLKLQDQIIENGISGAGREEHIFKLSDLTTNKYTPKPNDVVRFTAAVKNGVMTTSTSPELLKYVSVLNLYDANGVSVNLLDKIPEDIMETGSIGLNMSQEQADLLQKLIDEGQVFMNAVDEKQDAIIEGFKGVNDYLWNERTQNILKNSATPSEPSKESTENTQKAA